MFCSYCGTEAKESEARFCFQCGKELAEEATLPSKAIIPLSRFPSPIAGWFVIAAVLICVSYVGLSYIILKGGGASFKATNLFGLMLATGGLAAYSWKKTRGSAWIGFFLGLASSWAFFFVLMLTASHFASRPTPNPFDEFDFQPEQGQWKNYQRPPDSSAPPSGDPISLLPGAKSRP